MAINLSPSSKLARCYSPRADEMPCSRSESPSWRPIPAQRSRRMRCGTCV